MFEIAMEKSLLDEGVIRSTSDTLTFISRKVQAAASAGETEKQRLRFVLGMEVGIVTSIVDSVQGILKQESNRNVEADIIVPVSSEAVMSTEDEGAILPLVPGVTGGEGCSTAGGCATCPFMKMNDLDRVNDIVDLVIHPWRCSSSGDLSAHLSSSKRIPILSVGSG